MSNAERERIAQFIELFSKTDELVPGWISAEEHFGILFILAEDVRDGSYLTCSDLDDLYGEFKDE